MPLLKYWLVAVLGIVMLTQHDNANANAASEHEVRAAFIYKLLPFAIWPENFISGAPLQLCLIGASAPFSESMRQMNKPNILDRPLQIIEADSKNIATCDLIVTDAIQAPYNLNQLLKRSVLTIGETGFIDRGGMIGITVVANRVNFELNLATMRSAGFSMPAQVCKLALRTR